jgi:predicted HicB family RNase H-like nuclease
VSRAPRIGRPPMAKKERKGTLLSVRFPDADRHAMERAAKREGVSLSEWARRTLLRAAHGEATGS